MKISECTSKPASKFIMNMIYGISKSKDILLSSIAGALDEKTKKAYTSEKIGKRKFVNKTEKTNNSVSIVYIGNIVREQKEKEGRKKVSVWMSRE